MRAPTPGRLGAVVLTLCFASSGCLEFDANGRYLCDPSSGRDCVDGGDVIGPGGFAITTTALPDAYFGVPYSFTLSASGGQGAIIWSLESGALPEGLSLSPQGTISGTPAGGMEAHGALTQLALAASDAGGARTMAVLPLSRWLRPELRSEALPLAIIGLPYSTVLEAAFGKPPLTFSATQLPAGLFLKGDGTLAGSPEAGANPIFTAVVTDANQQATAKALEVPLLRPSPRVTGGTNGVAPDGAAATDAVIVFVLADGAPVGNAGVRVRKNGVEYDPPKEALTGADGSVTLTGLGLDGTTDTLDLTANAPGFANFSVLRTRAAIVSIPLSRYPEPWPRSNAAAAFDPISKQVLLFGGTIGAPAQQQLPSQQACSNDLVGLSDAATNAWRELVPSALGTSPLSRHGSVFEAAKGVMVLYGGQTCAQASPATDTWHYDPATKKWSQATTTCSNCAGGETTPLPARSGMSAARDAQGNIYMYGGYKTDGLYSSALWRYDSATRTWTNVSSSPPLGFPGGRTQAAMAIDASGDVVICGGNDGATTYRADCVGFSPAMNTWTLLPPLPLGVYSARMVLNPQDGQLYLFGGFGSTGPNSALYRQASSGGWSEVIASGGANGPKGGALNVFAFDPKLAALVVAPVMEGGTMWSTTGSTWVKRPAQAMPQTLSINLPPPPGGFGGQGASTLSAWKPDGWGTSRDVPFFFGSALLTYPGVATDLNIWAYSGDPTTGAPIATYESLGPPPMNPAWTSIPSSSVLSVGGSIAPGSAANLQYILRHGIEETAGLPWVKRNGGVEIGPNGTATLRHLAPKTGSFQRVTVGAVYETPGGCQGSIVSERVSPPQPFNLALMAGVTGMTPGAQTCSSNQNPTVTEATYAFSAPALEQLFMATARRRVSGFADDWVVVMPVSSGANSFSLPAPSTLAPSRQSARTQWVEWSVAVHGGGPNAPLPPRSFDSMSFTPLDVDRIALGLPARFIRQ